MRLVAFSWRRKDSRILLFPAVKRHNRIHQPPCPQLGRSETGDGKAARTEELAVAMFEEGTISQMDS
ncbi:uncharacterized [Tachysurus ichikawai]